MLKRMLIMIAALLVVFGGIFGWKWFVGMRIAEAMKAKASPPVTVSATTASNEVWHPMLYAVATLRAVEGTEVSPEVAGQVSQIAFKSGQKVRKGDLLVQLDVSVEKAKLQGLKAERDLAQVEFHRRQGLANTKAISPSDLDHAEAAFKQAQAAVESQQELIDKKTIRAPFDGRVGIRKVNLGDYLAPGAKIVTLQSTDPIYADFALPQEQVSQVKPGQSVLLQVDAYPKEKFEGKITAINSKVTETTRNLAIEATLANPDEKLRPGMFGEIAVELPEERGVVTLPRTAISYNPYGDSVFVLETQGTNAQGKATLKARRTFVQTGEERGTQVAIAKGVKAGEQVVTSGQMKLQQGSTVLINNKITPLNKASVTPADE